MYQRHRPTSLDDVVGQEAAVRTLQGFGDHVPAAVMFHGPSGCGKTTLARILAASVGCPVGSFDYVELNCGVLENPIGTVREIQDTMGLAPLGGKRRVWVLDEVQSLSRARFAMEGMLKVLEDGPPHASFYLCTTDPKRVVPAVRNRCSQIPVGLVRDEAVRGLVVRVAEAEGAEPLPGEVVSAIVTAAAGSPRAALVELEKVLGLADAADRLAAVGAGVSEQAAFDLVKVLVPFSGSPSWNAVSGVLSGLREQDPEGLRQMVLAAARTTLLKGGKASRLAHRVIDCLREPYFDRNTGHALLAADCYRVCFSE